MIQGVDSDDAGELIVVENFFEELKVTQCGLERRPVDGVVRTCRCFQPERSLPAPPPHLRERPSYR